MASLPIPFRRRSRAGPVLITGGGTAGHTNPGIAVAQALVSLGLRPDEIHFVGGIRGNEGELVPAAGFSIDLLPGRGIQRRLTAANIGAVIGLVAGLLRGLWIVARLRPRAVLCLGGYAAFAASAAAVVLRVPLVVTEQNARASAVNRLFGRFASANAIPFPGTDLPDGVLTGNPIRPAIVEAVAAGDRATARRAVLDRYGATELGPDGSGSPGRADDSASGSEPRGSEPRGSEDVGEPVMVAVWAGSLGATRVNRAVSELAELWADRDDVILYHVVGRRDWETHGGPRPSGALAYLRVAYEDHMPDLLVAADVAVCRAGASTVTELAVAGLPAVLVPLPNAPRDHQRANTGELEAAGGAVVVDDGELDGPTLAGLLEPLVVDAAGRAAMAAAARSVARPDAAADVARLLLATGQEMTTREDTREERNMP